MFVCQAVCWIVELMYISFICDHLTILLVYISFFFFKSTSSIWYDDILLQKCEMVILGSEFHCLGVCWLIICVKVGIVYFLVTCRPFMQVHIIRQNLLISDLCICGHVFCRSLSWDVIPLQSFLCFGTHHDMIIYKPFINFFVVQA